MSTLHETINSKQYMNTSKTIRKSSQNKDPAVFNALTLKEKCLCLVKISKKNTRFQALGLMGLTLLIIATDYLFTRII